MERETVVAERWLGVRFIVDLTVESGNKNSRGQLAIIASGEANWNDTARFFAASSSHFFV